MNFSLRDCSLTCLLVSISGADLLPYCLYMAVVFKYKHIVDRCIIGSQEFLNS